MGKFFTAVISVLLFSSLAYSQTSSDFKINSDNPSSTFNQSAPKLYNCGNKGFLVAWSDYRQGELKYYAQYFDSLGRKVNDNFEIISNYDAVFLSEDKFLVLKEEYYEYSYPMENSGFNLFAVKYNNFNLDNNPIYLAGGSYPWCGTGWLDYQHVLEADGNNYNFFFSSNGDLRYSSYDENFDLIYDSYDTLNLPSFTGRYAVDINNSNKAIFFINSYNNEMPVGYYFTLINPDNKITAVNIPVKIFDENEYTEYFNYGMLEIASLSDSLYMLLWADQNDEKVSYRTIKSNGEFADSLSFIEPIFPQVSFDYRSVERIIKVKNKFNTAPIIIESTYKLMSESSGRKNYTMVYFDETGKIIRSAESDSLTISNRLFPKDENTFFNISSDNKDIYLEELSDLNKTSAPVKINDDTFGSNESNPSVNFSSVNSIFVTWSNEQSRKGKEISITGSGLSEEKNINGSDFYFFEDGTKYNIEKVIINNNEQEYYLNIYDAGYNLAKQKLILKKSINSIISVSSKIVLQDEILLIVRDSTEIYIYKLNKEAEIIKKTVVVEYSNLPYTTKLFEENENSFWFYYRDYIQLFSNDLDTLSQKYNVGDTFDFYAGNNSFLSMPGYSSDKKMYGYIISFEGDTLKTGILYDKLVNSYRYKISDQKFAFVFSEDNNYYYSVFNYNLERLSEPVLINDYSHNLKKEISVSSLGSKIMFAWSEVRSGGVGYDIYGKILELPKTSAVDEKDNQQIPTNFELSQNYPNPFNPTTNIKYSLVQSGRTKIVLYDILGNEVQTLVDQIQSAGNYNVEFNALNLSSGIYFYRIITSGFTATKKMILIK